MPFACNVRLFVCLFLDNKQGDWATTALRVAGLLEIIPAVIGHRQGDTKDKSLQPFTRRQASTGWLGGQFAIHGHCWTVEGSGRTQGEPRLTMENMQSSHIKARDWTCNLSAMMWRR